MASLMSEGRQRYFTNTGAPAAGYKLWTYAAGTNTPKATYADAAEVGVNTNPVILDARGEATIFWRGGYKVKLTDAAGVEIWTVDALNELQPAFRTTDVGSALIPAGTTVQRDNPAAAGYFRYNRTLQRFEGYFDDATWKQFAMMRDWIERQNVYAVSTGTATAYAISVMNTVDDQADPNFTAYVAGMTFPVVFHTASGLNPTLQINGIAAPPNLVKQQSDGSYVNIVAGDILANHFSMVTLLSPVQALVERLPPLSFSALIPYDWDSIRNRI